MPVIGPVSCTNGPGAFTGEQLACVLWDSGVRPASSLSSVQVACSLTFTGGRDDASWSTRADAYDASGALVQNFVQITGNRFSTPSATGLFKPLPGVARVVVRFATDLYQGQTATGTATITTQEVAPCQYGTELTSLANAAVVITQDVIIAVLEPFDAEWLAPVFNILLYQVFDAQKLCHDAPIAPPPIGAGLLTAGFDTIFELFSALAWFLYCQCVPGTPAPVNPAPPVLTQPTTWPTQPTFPCDPAALCDAIVRIKQLLAAVAQTIGVDYQLTTFLQRYKLPFAYIKGAVHSGLTGEGSFPIPRLVGLLVEITAPDGSQPILAGNPPYLFDQGWMSVSEVNGMIEEKRITRTSFTWLPGSISICDHFNWHLFDGVTLRVTELEAEP